MAEKVTLQVELQSKLQQTKDITKKLADSGGFKNNDKALGRVNALLQELESLATKTNPSLKNLSSINALFNELSGILFKIAQATNTASKEFQDLAKQIAQTQSNLDKAQGERGSILKKGRISKDTGNYELYKTYQNQVIEQANIKNAKGRSIKTADTFFSKFDNGVAQQGAFQDAQAAQAVYDSLLRTQTENGTRLQELNTAIDNYKAALQKATADLEVQKTKEDSPTASQIIQNKIDVNSAIESQKEAIHQAANEKQETASISDYTKAVNNQSSALGRAFKQFTLYHIAVKAVKKALNEAVKTVQELDKYLTEQAMVTGLSRKQTYELVGSYQELALQCGATTKEIAQVSTEYMKQGKTIEESLTLTKAAVSAAKVARVSVGDSVNYLTTALNGFRLSAEDAMKVSDKFAAVAASSATDYDELAIALSKVASQANLAGMSIDYTTALLTKGLETTREAPETMGTALKTIIARMRELGDYGETLEDGVALNNVESQLQYVGIELRDQQGELRSTEDVLDELGKKWDTLNKNQQAAIAKALAGTRQQSRLIAMMEDYERVTELQQISARSAGATAAQAGVYLEGMEAAMNKIQVAWEKIVMNFTNSDVIIGAFELVGGALDKLGDFLDNTAAQVVVFGSLATIGLVVLGQKLKENELAKEDIRLQNQKLLIENKQSILNLKSEISKKKEIAAEKKIAAAKAKTTLETLKTAKAEAIKNKASKADLAKIDRQIEQQKKVVETSELEAQAAQNDVDISEHKIKTLEEQNLQLDSQLSLTGKLASVFSSLYGLMLLFKPIYAVILGFQNLINKEKNKEYVATLRQQAAESKGLKKKLLNAGAAMAESAAKIPVAGWIIAAGILAALGIATVSVAIANANKYNKSAEGTSEKINELSNEIYKLNEKSRAVDSITDSFDTLDNKIIKTNADIKEMGSLLEQAGEKLSNEEVDKKDDVGYGKGQTEQDWYNSLQSDEAKREALDLVKQRTDEEIKKKQQEQIDLINKMSDEELKTFLSGDTTNAAIIQARDAIYSINNSNLYDHIDQLKEEGKVSGNTAIALETLTQGILDNMSAEEAWEYASDKSGEKIKELTNSIANLTLDVENASGKMETLNIASILTSDDYSLKDQVKAYEKALTSLTQLGDEAATAAFKATYSHYEYFATLEDGVLDFIDSVGISIDEMNKLYGSWESLQKAGVDITQSQFESRFKNYLNELSATNGDVLAATRTVFGQFLGEEEKNLNAFIKMYGDLVQVGILNMGQNMDKVQNSINSFYEKALQWNTLSESDKAEFIQDHSDMFSGESGGELLKAFQSGNYEAIERALAENEALKDQLEKKREEIRQELIIEEARTGEDRNEAYIAQLKEYEKYLNDTENLFKASLEVRLEQEKKQLDEYRSFLEEQRDAEEESLEKRKEIYEKYFDEINQDQEDVEYDAQVDLLTKNLSKIASSTNATAVTQTKELEKKLADLESERLKELRERAQEAVLENMDDELERISEKFDKLLENNQAMLAKMGGDLQDPVKYISTLIGNQALNGATANELQSYIGTLQSTYGSGFKSGDLDDITVREENNQLILNVNGQEIRLDAQNEENLYSAIMRALTEIGLR